MVVIYHTGMSAQGNRGGHSPPHQLPPPNTSSPPPPMATGVTLPSIAPYATYGGPPSHYPDPNYAQQQHASPYGHVAVGQMGGGPPQYPHPQSAPRQRTAIACRYCRRRKIRCSGVDASVEGKCSNCVRFGQDCVFTPVSSQAQQVFVPAHAVYPHMRNMAIGPDGTAMVPHGAPPLFGAHGQRLGQAPAAPTSGQAYYGYSPSPPASGPYEHLPPMDPRRSDEGVQRAGHSNPANYSPGSSTSSQGPYLQAGQQGPGMARTPPPRGSPGDSRQDPMSLGSIMEHRPNAQIDRSMLGRLDRRNQQPGPQ